MSNCARESKISQGRQSQENCPLLCRTAHVRVMLRPHSFHQIPSDCNPQGKAREIHRLKIMKRVVRSKISKKQKLFLGKETVPQMEMCFELRRKPCCMWISISYVQPNSAALLVMASCVLSLLLSSAARSAAKPTCFGSAVSSLTTRWGVVQLVGHLTVNEDGEGSNPSAPANFLAARHFLCAPTFGGVRLQTIRA
jgi:hypothetical protein